MPDIACGGSVSLSDRALRQSLLDDCDSKIWQSIFETIAYRDWKAGRREAKLCIYAGPQCGKTTFAAAAFQDLQSIPDGVVLSIFLDCKDSTSNFPHGTFSDEEFSNALLNAIGAQLPKSKCSMQTPALTLEEARTRLRSQADPSKNIFLIIDGVESQPARSTQLLDQEVTNLIRQGFRILITTIDWKPPATCDCCGEDCLGNYWHCSQCMRDFDLCNACIDNSDRSIHPASHMRETFNSINLNLQVDVEAFVDREISRRIRDLHYDRRLHEFMLTARDRITGHIVRKAGHNFAVCKALLDYLRDEQMQGIDEITHLQDRISFPQTEVFEKILHRVKHQSKEQSRIALVALSIVSQTAEAGISIKVDELSDLLSTVVGGDCNPRRSELINLCQGMLAVDIDATVRFFHPSALIFLTENCEDDYRPIQIDMARRCLDYMRAVPRFSVWDSNSEQALLSFSDRRPFAAYAARAWGVYLKMSTCYHALSNGRHITASTTTSDAIILLGDDQVLASVLCLAYLTSTEVNLWSGCHPMHVCAHFGLSALIPYLSDVNNFRFKDPIYGRTPLVMAAMAGHLSFVESLPKPLHMVDQRSDVSDALLEVLKLDPCRSEEMIDMLLSQLPSIDGGKGSFESPAVACGVGQQPCPSSACPEDTPLIYAISNAEILPNRLWARLAVHAGVDINEWTCNGRTALQCAILECNAEMIELLLAQPAIALGLTDTVGKTVLHHAAQECEPDIIRHLLLHKRCNANILNMGDGNQSTALMLLFENRCQELEDEAKFLGVLDAFKGAGANFHCINKAGQGLLHVAVEQHKNFTFDFLVAQDLHYDAAEGRNSTDAELGTGKEQVDTPHRRVMTALEEAIFCSDEFNPCYQFTIEELLLRGADPDKVSYTGDNLINMSRRQERWEAAILLIQYSQADVGFGRDFEDLLVTAIRCGNKVAVEKLMTPGSRALRKYAGRLPSQLANDRRASEAIIQLLKRIEWKALQRFWPASKT